MSGAELLALIGMSGAAGAGAGGAAGGAATGAATGASMAVPAAEAVSLGGMSPAAFTAGQGALGGGLPLSMVAPGAAEGSVFATPPGALGGNAPMGVMAQTPPGTGKGGAGGMFSGGEGQKAATELMKMASASRGNTPPMPAFGGARTGGGTPPSVQQFLAQLRQRPGAQLRMGG